MLTGSSSRDASRDPGAGDGADPEGGRRHGSPVARRVVLAALGGVLVVGTAAATATRASDGHPSASGEGKGPAAGGTTTAPPVRHARLSARHERERPAGARSHSAPAHPEYYVGDGPMTVALTIDDGPSPRYTPQVLRVLEKHGVRATFSMVGNNVAYYPQVAREVASAGHLIANHTWSHQDVAALPAAAMREEVSRAAVEIHAATGQRPTLFRAPYGAWSPALLDYCAAQGLIPLDWSVDPRDWARPGVTAIVQDILRTTRSGSIILEHDGGGDRSQTVAALKIVLPRLLDKGFRFRVP
jgi:peptidoglycan/xylan/chitin deacetylase (PgdA/CDA1 family)